MIPAVLRALLMLLALGLAAPALAVHKCRDGNTPTYSDIPCPEAEPLKLDRDAPDRAAVKQLEQEKKELKQLERSRRRREAQEDKEQQRAARAAAVQGRKCTRLARELRWAEEDVRAAAGKRADRARLKAKRAAEQYEESCRHAGGLHIGAGT